MPLINVSWTPPINTLFDIDYYIVTSYLDGQFYSNTTTHNNNIILKLPPGEISIDVSTVSTCGTISRPIKCDRTSPAGHFGLFDNTLMTQMYIAISMLHGTTKKKNS